jgi:LETM1-like protein
VSTTSVQEEDTKKLLKAKTELARFLQQTVGEVAKDVRKNRTGATAADAKALYTFLKDVRAGHDVSNKDIMQFATLFSDELTLDNLDRVHLVTLCQARRRLRAHTQSACCLVNALLVRTAPLSVVAARVDQAR